MSSTEDNKVEQPDAEPQPEQPVEEPAVENAPAASEPVEPATEEAPSEDAPVASEPVEPEAEAEPEAVPEPEEPVAEPEPVEPEPEVKEEPEDDLKLPENLDVRITKMHVKTLLDTINNILDGRSLNNGNIIRVTYACVSLAKKMKNSDGTALKGALKKEAVLTAIATAIRTDKSLNEDDREILILMVHDVVGSAIDVLVDADGANKACCVIA